MELLIMWIVTIIASVSMEVANELRMFKDAADNGYKIDIKAISDFAKQVNPNASKATMMSLLVPVVNILGVLQRTMMYNNARSTILDQLSVIDSLIKMTKEEEDEYKKNPTTLNAIYITARDNSESNLTKISYLDGNEKSIISFRTENDNIILVKAEGPISKLSIVEQHAILIKKLAELNDNLNIHAFLDECNPKKNESMIIDLDKVKNDNCLSRQEQINELEKLKESVLNDKDTSHIKTVPMQKIIRRQKNKK